MPPERITGTVQRIRHYNDRTGWSVLDLVDREERICLVGVAPRVDTGDDVEATGSWQIDPKFGKQFKADEIRPLLPAGVDGLMRFLSSGRIEGIGKKMAERLIAHFGAGLPRVLDETPERLGEVPGIGRRKADRVVASWRAQTAVRDLLMFLGAHGVGTARALRIHKQWGANAITLIKQNPYRLAQEISGIGFLIADAIARSLGLDAQSPFRIGAALEHLLDQSRTLGNCGMPREELIGGAAKLLSVDAAIIPPVLLHAEQRATVQTDLVDDTPVVFTRRMHEAETFVARRIAALVQRPAGQLPHIRAMLAASDLPPLNEEKYHAIEIAFSSCITVITGGPGVGKTTVVNAIRHIAGELKWDVELAAPTGRAAKRLIESTGVGARTIHRLLEWSPDANGFTRNEENPLDCDLVVIDEASMVDILLFESLLGALGPSTRLLLVGDADQLPSVGPGQVLADIIRSGTVPVAHLREIFRQDAGSSIVVNAHRINHGNLPEYDRGAAGAFFFFRENDPAAARERIIDVVTRRLPGSFGLDPRKDVQVLTPMHKSDAGVEALNAALQRELNPASRGERHLAKGIYRFAEGDKVMQTLNNYEKEVFNGDIGFIQIIDPEEETLVVDFEGRLVDYTYDDLEQLTLAYATTIHKSQGSEFAAVVIPVVTAHFKMLQRNLLYTAVTRAKRLVVLVGQPEAVRISVQNASGNKRWTRLRQALGKLIPTSPSSDDGTRVSS
jgi:exodeoxyribonuclease V alpha subunit